MMWFFRLWTMEESLVKCFTRCSGRICLAFCRSGVFADEGGTRCRGVLRILPEADANQGAFGWNYLFGPDGLPPRISQWMA